METSASHKLSRPHSPGGTLQARRTRLKRLAAALEVAVAQAERGHGEELASFSERSLQFERELAQWIDAERRWLRRARAAWPEVDDDATIALLRGLQTPVDSRAPLAERIAIARDRIRRLHAYLTLAERSSSGEALGLHGPRELHCVPRAADEADLHPYELDGTRRHRPR